MNKIRSSKRTKRKSDDMRAEYEFDYSKARPNPYAKEYKTGSRVIVLDPDVAKIFTSPDTVNSILRALMASMRPRRSKRV